MQYLKDNWNLIASVLVGLLAISETLPWVKAIEANSIVQSVVNFVKSLLAPKA
jgi:hypothetical protein